MIARLRDAGVELREIVGVLELIGDHEPAALQLGIRIVARRLADLDTERVQAEAAMAALLFDAG